MSTLKTGKVKTTTIADELDTESTAVTNVINGSAKAWVDYNGAGNTIRDSFNITSVTDNATGEFDVNFTTAFSDANYCVVAAMSVYGFNSGGGQASAWLSSVSTGDAGNTYGNKTTSQCRLNCAINGNAKTDPVHVGAVFFK
jgi:hypothetical protein